MIELNKRALLTLACVGAAAFAYGVLQAGIVLPMSPSVRPTMLVADPTPLQRGDYVNAEILHPVIDRNQAVTLTKRAACLPGDQLTFQRNSHYCNGEWLGSVLQRTKDGQALQPFVWNGPVPEGMVFLSGDHARSFDSRYFGFVKAKSLRHLRVVF
jgi:conjugal transfer pilin signal peptidase TrbI